MRRDLKAYLPYQVFLNHPFDEEFIHLADAMSFAVVAAGLIPVSAFDLSAPDRPRLEMLVDAIQCCHYSAHDLSRSKGEGKRNWVRMNMPIEMGMALFHAIVSQRREHRCVFFVSTPHEYKAFASDLAGLDPKCHRSSEIQLLTDMYDWLRGVVPNSIVNSQPTADIVTKFREFKRRLKGINGASSAGKPSHDERREMMYQVCAECGWWDWRGTRSGRDQFPAVPLSIAT